MLAWNGTSQQRPCKCHQNRNVRTCLLFMGSTSMSTESLDWACNAETMLAYDGFFVWVKVPLQLSSFVLPSLYFPDNTVADGLVVLLLLFSVLYCIVIIGCCFLHWKASLLPSQTRKWIQGEHSLFGNNQPLRGVSTFFVIISSRRFAHKVYASAWSLQPLSYWEDLKFFVVLYMCFVVSCRSNTTTRHNLILVSQYWWKWATRQSSNLWPQDRGNRHYFFAWQGKIHGWVGMSWYNLAGINIWRAKTR